MSGERELPFEPKEPVCDPAFSQNLFTFRGLPGLRK